MTSFGAGGRAANGRAARACLGEENCAPWSLVINYFPRPNFIHVLSMSCLNILKQKTKKKGKILILALGNGGEIDWKTNPDGTADAMPVLCHRQGVIDNLTALRLDGGQ